MPKWTLLWILTPAVCLEQGCLALPKGGSNGDQCSAPGEHAGGTIRVKAPPQKIVIEHQECAEQEGENYKGRPESAPAPPEKERGRSESAPERRRETRAPRPEAEQVAGRSEGALSTLG